MWKESCTIQERIGMWNGITWHQEDSYVTTATAAAATSPIAGAIFVVPICCCRWWRLLLLGSISFSIFMSVRRLCCRTWCFASFCMYWMWYLCSHLHRSKSSRIVRSFICAPSLSLCLYTRFDCIHMYARHLYEPLISFNLYLTYFVIFVLLFLFFSFFSAFPLSLLVLFVWLVSRTSVLIEKNIWNVPLHVCFCRSFYHSILYLCAFQTPHFFAVLCFAHRKFRKKIRLDVRILTHALDTSHIYFDGCTYIHCKCP